MPRRRMRAAAEVVNAPADDGVQPLASALLLQPTPPPTPPPLLPTLTPPPPSTPFPRKARPEAMLSALGVLPTIRLPDAPKELLVVAPQLVCYYRRRARAAASSHTHTQQRRSVSLSCRKPARPRCASAGMQWSPISASPCAPPHHAVMGQPRLVRGRRLVSSRRSGGGEPQVLLVLLSDVARTGGLFARFAGVGGDEKVLCVATSPLAAAATTAHVGTRQGRRCCRPRRWPQQAQQRGGAQPS